MKSIDVYEYALRSGGVTTRAQLDAALDTWEFNPPLSWSERAELRRRFVVPPQRPRYARRRDRYTLPIHADLTPKETQ